MLTLEEQQRLATLIQEHDEKTVVDKPGISTDVFASALKQIYSQENISQLTYKNRVLTGLTPKWSK